MANENEASSSISSSDSNSGDKEDQNLLSQLKYHADQYKDNMEKLISKKRRDAHDDMMQSNSVEMAAHSFITVLADLVAKIEGSQQRDAVIDQIEEIKEIDAILKMMKSFSDHARDYKAAAAAQMAVYDQDIQWMQHLNFSLRLTACKIGGTWWYRG